MTIPSGAAVRYRGKLGRKIFAQRGTLCRGQLAIAFEDGTVAIAERRDVAYVARHYYSDPGLRNSDVPLLSLAIGPVLGARR